MLLWGIFLGFTELELGQARPSRQSRHPGACLRVPPHRSGFQTVPWRGLHTGAAGEELQMNAAFRGGFSPRDPRKRKCLDLVFCPSGFSFLFYQEESLETRQGRNGEIVFEDLFCLFKRKGRCRYYLVCMCVCVCMYKQNIGNPFPSHHS